MARFFMVVCERGHMGCGKSNYIKFAFQAPTLLDAMNMARKMPSVKHTKLCVNAREISYEEYKEYRTINAYERYEQYKRRR